eukprot:3809011-Rhodomonas_salina.2
MIPLLTDVILIPLLTDFNESVKTGECSADLIELCKVLLAWSQQSGFPDDAPAPALQHLAPLAPTS